MRWVDAWVGLPYADCGRGPDRYDCWGLVQAVYRDVFDVALPGYDDDYASSVAGAEIQTLIDRESRVWQRIADQADIRLGDVVIFRILGQRMHCGIALDTEQFLHVLQGCEAVVERLTSPVWRNRISGIYRHEAMT